MSKHAIAQNAMNRAERMFRGQLPRHLLDHGEVPVNPDGSPISVRERDAAEALEWKFHDRNANLQGRNQHLLPTSLFGNVLSIIHPSVEFYGATHGSRTSQLAVYIAQTENVTDAKGLEALKNAALMHDLGRRAEASKDDPGHALKSAEMADRFIRGDSVGMHQGDLREAVCRLIARHTLNWATPPVDPLLRALHDADALEAARFPGELGRMLRAKRWPRLLTPFARSEHVQAKWMKKYAEG